MAIECSNGDTVTYAALDRTLDALAYRLLDLGLRPGHTAAIITGEGHRYLVTLLALARIGVTGASGKLPPTFADVVVSDYAPGTVDHPRVVQLDKLWPTSGLAVDTPPVPMHTDGSAILLLSPSSGTTTGAPKFVPVSQDVMAERMALWAMHLPLPADARHSCFVNPFAGYGLVSVLRAFWSGCTALEPNLKSEQLPSWLVTSRVSHISISPIGLRKLLDVLPPEGVACGLRTIEISGGILPRLTYELAQERLPASVIVTFGATEIGIAATAPFTALAGRPGAVGYALPGVTVQVVDDDDNPLPAGEEGILRVRGMGTASGYRGNDAAAARVFRNGWVYPNDRAVLDGDGLLRVTGRTDDVIVIDGVKFNPQAMEEVLLGLADLREVAVFGAHDDRGLTAVCAAIVPNAPLDANDFHARCRERLGNRAPVFIIHLRELPRNAMGKVQRAELARIAIEATRGRATATPHSPAPAGRAP